MGALDVARVGGGLGLLHVLADLAHHVILAGTGRAAGALLQVCRRVEQQQVDRLALAGCLLLG